MFYAGPTEQEIRDTKTRSRQKMSQLKECLDIQLKEKFARKKRQREDILQLEKQALNDNCSDAYDLGCHNLSQTITKNVTLANDQSNHTSNKSLINMYSDSPLKGNRQKSNW